jgi:cell division protein FtsN
MRLQRRATHLSGPEGHRGRFNDQRRGLEAQRGGFAVGLIIGLLIGLALALGVALYVTKVPVPFVNKVPQRTAGQDAAEAEKNKNWDPNGPLYGKNPAKPNAPASSAAAPTVAMPTTVPAPATRASPPGRDTSAIPALPADRASSSPRTTAAASAATGPDPFAYFVQAGAYGRTEDAEQQRAKLAMLGMEAKLTEREQAGKTVYRVRVGPYDKKGDADATKEKLAAAGVEAALVRVQK